MSYYDSTNRIAHQGRVLLNTRINFHDGHSPPPKKESWEEANYWRGEAGPDWHVVRHQPKDKTWAISTHANATKHHQIKYQLVATHVSGLVVKATVWKCSNRCASEIQVDAPSAIRGIPLRMRCWHCSKF